MAVMNKWSLVWIAIISLSMGAVGVAKELPEGISMKESQPISNPVMTQSDKDYYHEGIKFFSDVTIAVPGAPKAQRSYRFYHGGFKILSVDADDRSAHYSGNKDYRIWVWKDSVTIYCLDDDYYVYVRFDESGDPIFQSNAERDSDRKTYMENKREYELQRER